LDKDQATGETYCLAHHISAVEGKRSIFVASLRYYDVFVRADGRWLFGERKLIVDWTETRPIVS
jgi:SnoaL-like domain